MSYINIAKIDQDISRECTAYDIECDLTDRCYRSLARVLAHYAERVRQLAEYCNDYRPVEGTISTGERKLSAHLMALLVDEIEHELPQMVRNESDADARCDDMRKPASDLAREVAADMSRCIEGAIARRESKANG